MRPPRFIFRCRQCYKNVDKPRTKHSARSLMKYLLELPNGHVYDFKKDWFCGACRGKLVAKNYHKLPPLYERKSAAASANHLKEQLSPHEGGQCMVCRAGCGGQSEINLEPSGNKMLLLAKQLDVIFILRQLFRVPPDKLEEYLQDFGNPAEWKVTLCRECSAQATLARNLHQTILNATVQLQMIREKWIEQVKAHGELESEEGGSSGVNSGRSLILEETENFILSHNYGPKCPVNRDTLGDKLAAELSSKMDFAAEETPVPIKEEEPELGAPEESDFPLELPGDDDDYEPLDSPDPDVMKGNDLETETMPKTEEEPVPEDALSLKGKPEVDSAATPFPDPGNRFTRKRRKRKLVLVKKIKVGVGHGPIKCHLCEEVVSTDLQWKRHLVTSHHLDCIICPVEECRKEIRGFYRMQDYRRHLETHNDKSELTCKLCGRVFNWKKNCIQHVRDFHSARAEARRASLKLKQEQRHPPKHCLICNENFRGFKAFSDHNKAVHGVRSRGAPGGSVEHKCRFCGTRRKTRNTLLRHILRVHENVHRWDFYCHLCGTKRNSRLGFRTHLLSQHPEDPATEALKEEGYSLEKCGVKGCRRTFIQKEKLEQHLQTVHKDPDGGKPFSCSFCGKGFFQTTKLYRHELIHKNEGTTNYQCTLCGKRFSTPDYLYVHERYTCAQRKSKKFPGGGGPASGGNLKLVQQQ